MKTFFFVLLALNLALGAWLWLGGPVDTVREPARLNLQVAPDSFQPLTDADLAQLRGQAEKEAAAAKASAAAAAATAAATATAAIEVPQTDCILIVNFSSDSTAKKLRARLIESGLGNRIASETENQKNRLRITGVDGATEARIQQALKEYPKLSLEHCVGARGAH